jgi:carbon-monoxide dehydrogenase large subunit
MIRLSDRAGFDDLPHAVVLRSLHAHAHLQSIDTATAKTTPGILAVLTGADALADRLKRLLPYVEAATQTGEPFASSQTDLLERPRDLFWGPASFCAIRVGEREPSGG